MTDFVLPTQSSFDGLTTSGYTLTDADEGFLTKEVGGIIKLLADQMTSSELIHVRATRTSTGKTEKFIIDNIADWSAGPKILTSDHFGDTFLDCTGFLTYTGNDAKVFQNTLPTPTIVNDSDGVPTSLTIAVVGGTDIVLDLTANPDARSSSQIAGFTGNIGTMAEFKNSSDTALGAEADTLSPELAIVMPLPVPTAKPAWDSFGHSTLFSSVFNRLPVNGVMVVNHVEFATINDALWAVLDAHSTQGHTYEATWLVSGAGEDTSATDVACIKRLS